MFNITKIHSCPFCPSFFPFLTNSKFSFIIKPSSPPKIILSPTPFYTTPSPRHNSFSNKLRLLARKAGISCVFFLPTANSSPKKFLTSCKFSSKKIC
nr:MAG TPA: restriction alleviation protein [Caudoviricetes sp.]